MKLPGFVQRSDPEESPAAKQRVRKEAMREFENQAKEAHDKQLGVFFDPDLYG